MRENIGIFRGKNKGSLWIEGNLIQRVGEDGNVTAWIGSTRPFALPNEADPETVGEFTGLTDKNGRRVFEGDITKMYYDEDEYSISAVYWSDCVFCVYYDSTDFDYTAIGFLDDNDFEVIGNKFDNPEFLDRE